MKIGIISGSHRSSSNSGKTAEFCRNVLSGKNISSYILNLEKNRIPQWEEEFWNKTDEWVKIWNPISSELKECEGFIIISPEYGGMVPSALKNFFLFCSSEMAHKPGLIISVSSGRGGSYPVAELRMSSYKNSHICYIPEHVIIRDANNMLKTDGSASQDDIYIQERIQYCLNILVGYSSALTEVRKQNLIDLKKYPNGM